MVVVNGPRDAKVHSSKGNQLKWKLGDKWYKADFLGYEGAAEYFVSEVLRHSNIMNFVPYQLEQIKYNGRTLTGCVSCDFLKDGQTIITSQRLFLSYYGNSVDKIIGGQPVSDRIQSFVEYIEDATDIHDFGIYLTMLIELDALTLNEDRHFHNIAVTRSLENTYSLCPVFDNGAALLSDVKNDYPINQNILELITKVYAKPFLTQFDMQMEVCRSLYGKQLQILDFDISPCMKEIEKVYSLEISERIRAIYEYQKEKYSEMFFVSKSPQKMKF